MNSLLKLKTLNNLALVLSLFFLAGCQHWPATDATVETTVEVEAESQSEAAPAEEAKSDDTLVCECPVAEVAVAELECPKLPLVVPTRPKQSATRSIEELLIIGRVENVFIQSTKVKLKARIDTGAGLTSLHAIEMVTFERDGKPWIKFKVQVKKQPPIKIERPIERFVEIKQQGGDTQRRPVVLISIRLGEIEEQVEITLTDRGDYVYPVLIGRNYLRDRAIVDVSRKYTVKYPG